MQQRELGLRDCGVTLSEPLKWPQCALAATSLLKTGEIVSRGGPIWSS